MNATYELQKELLTLSNSILGIDPNSKRESATTEQLTKLTKLGFSDHWLKSKTIITKFPALKIIHNNAIKEICKKYNLINGPIDRFIGEIPKKNADEILNNTNYVKKNGGARLSKEKL